MTNDPIRARSWTEFIAGLTDLKTNYETGSLTINFGSVMTLILTGVFDEWFDPEQLGIEFYRARIAELKKALKSSATGGKAKKNQTFGVSDIITDFDLQVWRYENNPLYTFNFVNKFSAELKSMHFKETGKAKYPMKSSEYMLYTDWNDVFENVNTYTYFSKPADGKLRLAVLGMVKDFRDAGFEKDGVKKESLVFKMFLGDCMTEDLRVWGNFRSNKVPKAIRENVKNGAIGLCIIKPNLWNGRKTGSVEDFILLK